MEEFTYMWTSGNLIDLAFFAFITAYFMAIFLCVMFMLWYPIYSMIEWIDTRWSTQKRAQAKVIRTKQKLIYPWPFTMLPLVVGSVIVPLFLSTGSDNGDPYLRVRVLLKLDGSFRRVWCEADSFSYPLFKGTPVTLTYYKGLFTRHIYPLRIR